MVNYGIGKTVTRGTSTIMAYTLAAILIFVLGVTTFSILDRNTEFAISVFGSLVGGFLGALLASVIVAGVLSRTENGSGNDTVRLPDQRGG